MSMFTNMSLRLKGIVMTLIVSASLLTVTLIASAALKTLTGQITAVSEVSIPQLEGISAVERILKNAHFEFIRSVALANTGVTGGPLDKQLALATNARAEVQSLVDQYDKGIPVPLLSQTREIVVSYITANTTALDMLGFDPITGTLFANDTDVIYNDMVKISTKIMAEQRAEISQSSAHAIEVAAADTQQFQTVAVLFLLFSVIVTSFLIRTISKPIERMTRNMRALAEKDLDIKIEGTHLKNEIGGMAAALAVFHASAVESAGLQEGVAKSLDRARVGDFSHRLQDDFSDPSLDQVKTGFNDLLENVEHGLRATGDVLTQLSQGDLRARMGGTFYGDFEKLQRDVNSTAQQFEAAMTEISESAEDVSMNASEISNSAHNLAQRTELTAANLAQTSTTMDELTVLVRSAAGGVDVVNQLAQKTLGNTKAGEEIVLKVVEAMKEISDFSTNIESVVAVINDIAFQTNLLALNAGVEAARAGESGLGFSVVASEVRALALRTAESSKEIEVLISKSSNSVTRGVDLVQKTSEALGIMSKDISEIAQNVSGIAEGASSQAQGISDATSAIAQVDSATQQNAAMFEETTAASLSLTASSNTLKELSARFETDRTAGKREGSSGFGNRAA